MMMPLLLTLLAATTQTDAIYTGVVPANTPTFTVTIGSSAPFYAAMRMGDEWVMDHRTEIKPTQMVDFIPDIPGYSGEPTRALMRNVQVVYEPPAMRRKRLEETWTSMGYAFIETAAGWRVVKAEDIQLAERARQLAESAAARTAIPAAADPAAEILAAESASRFSVPALWAIRVGIVSAAFLLLFLLYRFGRSRGESWMRVE